jgi:hypothetical protein
LVKKVLFLPQHNFPAATLIGVDIHAPSFSRNSGWRHIMQRQPASPDGQFGEALKFFRPQVACTVQKVSTRGGKDRTLNLELAPVLNREANWDEKTTVQVSSVELPRFCACLLRILPQVEFKYHGEHKNKSYQLQWQSGGGLRLDLSKPGKKQFIALTGDEVFWVADMAIDQLHHNVQTMSKTDLMNLLTRSFKGGSDPKPSARPSAQSPEHTEVS